MNNNALRLLRQRYFENEDDSWEKLVNRVVDRVFLKKNKIDVKLKDKIRNDIFNLVWLPNSPVLANSHKEKFGGFACQPYDSMVLTSDGFLPIGKIVEETLNVDLITHFGKTKIINYFSNGEKEVFAIGTEKGYSVSATGDHKILILPAAKIKKSIHCTAEYVNRFAIWKTIDEVDIGDAVIISPYNFDGNSVYQFLPNNIKIDEDFVYFIAMLQSDGHIKYHRSGKTIHNGKSLVCEIIVDNDISERIITKFMPAANIIIHSSGVKRIRGYGNEYNYLLDLCEYGTYCATIPEFIFTSPKTVIAAYISAWFDAEGHVDSNHALRLSSCSKEIVYGLQKLLKLFNIISSIGEYKYEGKSKIYILDITHKFDRKQFCNEIGFRNPRKQEQLLAQTANVNGVRKKIAFKVLSKESLGVMPVYDISTENETYISDNIVVHNCFVAGPTEDTLENHLDTLSDIAHVAKAGGGAGFTGTHIRAANSPVAGSAHGYSYGPNNWARAVSQYMHMLTQSGFRRMALMYTLSSDHPDLESFIHLKQSGDETDLYNFNQSVFASDAWMDKAINDAESQEAKLLWELAKNAWQNGEPGLLFADTINNNTPYKYSAQTIYASNPCGEQPLPAHGACNLASINLSHENLFNENTNQFDFTSLQDIVRRMVIFMDTLGDVNHFPNKKFANWYADNRPIGIGVMGFADLLLKLKIRYGSQESIDLLRNIMKIIQETSYNESEKLGKLRGVPKACRKLPKRRRNITTVSIAPTGSIAFIAGCSHGIEPIFSPNFTRTDERGETYIEVHPLANESFFVSAVDSQNVPTWKEHVDIQIAAQQFCDSGISKTINMEESVTVEDVWKAFVYAWKHGCKGLTIYRNNSRQIQVLKTNTVETVEKNNLEIACDGCGNVNLQFIEGCATCEVCGVSMCSV